MEPCGASVGSAACTARKRRVTLKSACACSKAVSASGSPAPAAAVITRWSAPTAANSACSDASSVRSACIRCSASFSPRRGKAARSQHHFSAARLPLRRATTPAPACRWCPGSTSFCRFRGSQELSC